MGLPLPLSALKGLDVKAAKGQGEQQLRLEREAGTLHLDGRFSEGKGAGFYRFVPSATYLQTMAGLGFSELGSEDRLALAVFDVSSARVKALQQLGFKDLSSEDLMKAGIFDITPEYVQALRKQGYDKLTFDEVVEGRIHGVTPGASRPCASWASRGSPTTT